MTIREILKFLFGISGKFSPNKIIKETGNTIFQQSMFLASHLMILIMKNSKGINSSRIKSAISIQRLFAKNTMHMNIDMSENEIVEIFQDMNKSLNEMDEEEKIFHESETIVNSSAGLPPIVREELINHLMIFCLVNEINTQSDISKFKELALLTLGNQKPINFDKIKISAEKSTKLYNLT